jgi:hypothetical protein
MISKTQMHEALVLAAVGLIARFLQTGMLSELLMPMVILGYLVMGVVLSYCMHAFSLNTTYKWALLGLAIYLPGLMFGILAGSSAAIKDLSIGVIQLMVSGYAVSRL